jgi:hypothetical protein
MSFEIAITVSGKLNGRTGLRQSCNYGRKSIIAKLLVPATLSTQMKGFQEIFHKNLPRTTTGRHLFVITSPLQIRNMEGIE